MFPHFPLWRVMMDRDVKSGPLVLRVPALCKRYGFSGPSALYRAIEREGFPKLVRISERAVACVVAECDAWLERRIALRDADTWTSLGDAAARVVEKAKP